MLAALAAAVPVSAADPVVLRRGNRADPESLDPAHIQSVHANRILNDLFEPLVTLDAADRPVPAAADHWQVSADGLTYSFHLRPGLRWSDGTRLTAADFVYAIRRVIDPANASHFSALLYPIANASEIARGRLRDLSRLGVEAVDANWLRFRLVRPTPYWVSLMSQPMFLPLKRAMVEQWGDGFIQPGRLISNGPFMLRDWVKGSRLVLVKNPHYRAAAAVRLDQVIFYPIESESEELKRYRAGDLDVTYFVPSQQIDLIRQNMGGDWRSEPSLTMDYLGFNMTAPPFADNAKLRQALSMAIDRQQLVDRVVRTGAPVAYSVAPVALLPDFVDQPADWAWLPMPEKIAKARQLYREAGYGDGNPLQVELRTNSSDNVRKMAGAIAAMWQSALGVHTLLVAEDYNNFLDHRRKRAGLQIFWYSWTGSYPDATTFLYLFTTGATGNDFGYSNMRYDQLIGAAEQTADPILRISQLEQAEALLIAESPVAPLFNRQQPYLVKPWVRGYHIDPCGNSYDREVVILPH